MNDTYCIGIDLGSSYTCVCSWTRNGIGIVPNHKDGTSVIPTTIGFSDSQIVTGLEARKLSEISPRNVITEVLRLLGRNADESEIRDFKKSAPFKMIIMKNRPCVQVEIDSELKTFTPEDIIKYFFEELKLSVDACLGLNPENSVVISVGTSLNRLQNKLLKEAASIAGFQVVKITTSQNTAGIAYAFQHHALERERKIMIIDIGGCNTTAAIYTIDGPILETVNSSSIVTGGENFDRRLLDFLVQEFVQMYHKDLRLHPAALARLKQCAECAKIALSSKKEIEIQVDDLLDGITFKTKVTRRQLEDICIDLYWDILRPIEEVLNDSKLDKSSLKDIVLVGGSSTIPKIQELIQEFFVNQTLNLNFQADDCTALGSAILAASLNNCDEEVIQDLLLIDSIPLPLGIETAGGVMTKLIDKNAFPPLVVSKTFTTFNDDEDIITILIYEGSSTMTKYNNLLGSLTISGIARANRGVPKIEVTFELFDNLVLRVSAREINTGHFGETTIRDVRTYKEGEEVVATQLVSCNR